MIDPSEPESTAANTIRTRFDPVQVCDQVIGDDAPRCPLLDGPTASNATANSAPCYDATRASTQSGSPALFETALDPSAAPELYVDPVVPA